MIRDNAFMKNPLLEIITARADSIRLDIPEVAYQAFRAQFHSAKRREIPFLFTLPEWWKWWQTDDRWARRGRTGDDLVMARFGDVGPYSPDNVYCATSNQNRSDVSTLVRRIGQRRRVEAEKNDPTFEHHLAVRGDGHPKARAVLTPKGRFGSAALAAEAFNVTRQHAARLAKQERDGWAYE